MAFTLFMTIVFAVIFIALAVWFIIIYFQEGPKPQDFTIIDNFMPQYTNGFSQGILLQIDLGEKRNGYSFVPKDIDYYGRKKQKNMAKIVPQMIYVDKRKVISFARGTFSGERNRMWLLPPQPEDLPEELKRTELGKAIMQMLSEINNKKTEVESIREGSERIREIIDRQGDGESSEKEFERLDAMHENLLKHMNKVEEKKTTFGTSTPSN